MPDKTKFMGMQTLNLGEDKEDIIPSQLMVNSSSAPISSSKYIVEELMKKADSAIAYVNASNADEHKLTKAILYLHGIVQSAESFNLLSHLRILMATNDFDVLDQAISHPILAPIVVYLAMKIENVPFYLDWNIAITKSKFLFLKPKYGYAINWFYTQENPYIENANVNQAQ